MPSHRLNGLKGLASWLISQTGRWRADCKADCGSSGRRGMEVGEIKMLVFPRVIWVILALLAWQALSIEGRAQDQPPSAVAGVAEFSPYPLRPPQLDSPRATLESFLRHAAQAIERRQAEAPFDAIRRSFRRAMLCLDLSEFPLATREGTGFEKVLLLKEILDRIELPPFEEIPDLAAVEQTGLASWRLPDTELTLDRIAEGPRAGEFVFNSRTVQALERFYELSKHLPYKPGTTVGAYEDFLYGPGPLLSTAWVDALPAWTHNVVVQQTLWQWIAWLLLLAGVVAATLLVYRLGTWWDERFRDVSVWLQLGRPLTGVFVILAMMMASKVMDDGINLTGNVWIVSRFALDVARYAAGAWLAVLIIKRIGRGIINTRQLLPERLNAQLIRTVANLVAVVVVIYIAVIGAEVFGIPVAPLIAGLGIGGLAIALAVRPTLENIIGGFILFADKPIRVGDFCSFGEKRGTVEAIGMRSTRIRALDRTVITVPNAEFSNMQLINWALCDRMLILRTIGLRYETKPEQTRHVLAKLREMCLAHPKIDKDSLRIRFVGYGASAQEIQIRIYALTRDWNEFYAIQEDVFLRIGEIVEESGTGFARPSQTLYVTRDPGMDEARSAEAMQEVQGWRTAGRLPFPRMAPALQERLEDTLDYPPRGSPDAFNPEALEKEASEPLSSEAEEDLKEEEGKEKKKNKPEAKQTEG